MRAILLRDLGRTARGKLGTSDVGFRDGTTDARNHFRQRCAVEAASDRKDDHLGPDDPTEAKRERRFISRP